MVSVGDIVPYTCIHIDADFRDLLEAVKRCFRPSRAHSRQEVVQKLQKLFTRVTNQNHVLPCLSVRSAFDLFLDVMRFPPHSDVIMSAINIPDMVTIVQNHHLNVVPLDVDLNTLAPMVDLLPSLIGRNTVAVVVAHVFGCVSDVGPIIEVCRENGLYFVEDCAEAFGGYHYLGHPSADLALFSFGVIKYQTAFGGAVAKIRDQSLYERMREHYETYREQTNLDYLKKLVKYAGIYFLLDVPSLMRPVMKLAKWLHWDYQFSVVEWLRGFPAELTNRIRHKPSMALLLTMLDRLGSVSEESAGNVVSKIKAMYVVNRITRYVRMAGLQAEVKNFWLFPIIVPNSALFSVILNKIGIDSYKGVTQLDAILPSKSHCICSASPSREFVLENTSNPSAYVVENSIEKDVPSVLFASSSSSGIKGVSPILQNPRNSFECGHQAPEDTTINYLPAGPGCCLYPHSAKFLIDHVVYLPVHKDVPFRYLDVICEGVKLANCIIYNQSEGLTVDQIALDVLKSKL